MERILICTPTFHSDPVWIKRSTESIQAQTYSYFDCYLVKDSCTRCDKTCLECENCKEIESICKNIVKQDSRFKYFNLPYHCGYSGWGPRNFAITNSENDLIAYLDDDNWYEPDHLQSLYEAIKENNADLAYTGSRLINKNNEVVLERVHPFEPKAGYIDTSEMLHKRWLINRYGGWRRVNKGSDWDIVSRWLPNLSWCHTNKITLNFFLRDGCGIHRV